MSDVKRFLQLCKNGILNSDTLNGTFLQHALEKLDILTADDKKNINLNEI